MKNVAGGTAIGRVRPVSSVQRYYRASVDNNLLVLVYFEVVVVVGAAFVVAVGVGN